MVLFGIAGTQVMRLRGACAQLSDDGEGGRRGGNERRRVDYDVRRRRTKIEKRERRKRKGRQPNRTKRRPRRWMMTLAGVRRDDSAESSHDGGACAHGPGNTITKSVESGTMVQSSRERCAVGTRG